MNTEFKELSGLKCVVRYPENFDSTKKYPTILFLHGAGTRGEDPKKLLGNPFFLKLEQTDDMPVVVIAPQCCKNSWFDLFEHLIEFAKSISTLDFVDTKKIALMGASMGGYASWQLAMSIPEYFSCLVALCGGGMYWNAGRLVNVPVWAFHGEKDTTVFPEESKRMVDAVNLFGGKAKLTLYPKNGHDCWNDTYSNRQVFDWILAQENKNETIIRDKYKNSNIYG